MILKWLGDKLILAIGAIVVAITILFSVRLAGIRAEQLRNLRVTMKAVGKKNEISNNIDSLSSNERIKLRKKWTRD